MRELAESIVRGLGIGSVYALLALGFVIIYKATKVISFAQPAFMLAGAVLVTYLVGPLGFFVALPLAALATGAFAIGIERVAIRPMIGKAAFVVAIITLGIDVAVRVVVNAFIGLNVRYVGDPWGVATIPIFGIAVQQRHIAMLVITALLVTALFMFFRYTRMGLAMRAAAYDQEAALAQGVSVGAVFALSWGLAGALAAVAGTFAAVGESVNEGLWLIALVALPVIILGGLDSLLGAVIGGLVVGVVQELTATYQVFLGDRVTAVINWFADLFGLTALDENVLGDNFSVITPYLVMMLVLLIRPYGLFGTREVERV